MADTQWDPVYRNAKREALVILAAYSVSLIYTVSYCYANGYGRPPESIETYWGIPDWVFWGVFAPWTACALFTTWFTFFYMGDDDLGAAPASDAPASPGSPVDREADRDAA